MSPIYGRRWVAVAGFAMLSVCAVYGQTKVAVINSQTALLDTADMKKTQAAMEAKYKPRQEAITKLQKEVDGIQQQLQTMGDKLTAQAQNDLTVQGQRKQRDLQRLTEDLQADVDRERNDILTKSGDRMQKAIAKLAEEKGLDMVIDTGNTLYFKPVLDITKEATAAYDKAYPVK